MASSGVASADGKAGITSGNDLSTDWRSKLAVTDKTRKILWGRSGNRCAKCRLSLVELEQLPDTASVVGDEAHIHAQSAGGPRYDPTFTPEQLDHYDNLILLCRVDHKIIDDQVATYSADALRDMKRVHEQWVRDSLEPKTQELPFLFRMLKGKNLTDLISVASEAYSFDSDPLETKQEVELGPVVNSA